MQRLKKGDHVRVISGSNKGKEGTILKLFPKQNKAQIDGVNVFKRHKKNTDTTKEKLNDVILPIDLSNLALIDNKAKGATTKIKFGYDKNNKKVRVSKLSNNAIGAK